MIEIIFTSKLFITVGIVLSIIITLAIFKKLLKVALFVFCLIFLLGFYTYKTGIEPIETVKSFHKKHQEDQFQKDFKKNTEAAVKFLDNEILKDTRMIEKKVDKALSKAMDRKNVEETAARVLDAVEDLSNKSSKEVEKISTKLDKEKEKAQDKLKAELKKHKKFFNN